MAQLMRIGGIEMPDSLYDASISAQTFEGVGQVIINQIDFEEIVEVDMTRATGVIKFPRIKWYGEF